MAHDPDSHDLFPPDPESWHDRDDPRDPWYLQDLYDDPGPQPWWAAARGMGGPRDRLTHLVLVDGRLVDSWSEPVEPTRWAQVAEWLDDKERPREVMHLPSRLPHEAALDWLDSLVGGRTALDALDDEPLHKPATIDVTRLPLAARHRVEAVGRALDGAAVEFWDDEVRHALHAVLLALWAEDRDRVLRARSAAQVAGGICWLVGRANDLFGPGRLTQQAAQRHLGLRTALSSYGTSVHHSLRGLQPPYGSRPSRQSDLLATGRPGFLVSSIRLRLVRLRDQALAAAEQHAADERRKGRLTDAAPD